MQPQQQGGQYLPNMMHQGPAGMNMGPQSSVSMTAQQMLAQVRSPPQPNVRSPGPRGPMGGMPGMPSPRGMQPSPRHQQPTMDDGMGGGMMLPGPGPQVGGPGQGQGNGDPDSGQNSGMTPQDQLSKYVETL